MSKFCEKVPPDTPARGISQEAANEVENFKHNRICLIDSNAPSHWLKTKFYIDTYAPLASSYRPEYRFRNAMQATTVNQNANKDAETMFNFFTQVGTTTNANMEAITCDLNQIKKDAEAASAPVEAVASTSPAHEGQASDDKVITMLGIEKDILPPWILSKLAKVIDQVLHEERKAKQIRDEGDNDDGDTDMSSQSSIKPASAGSDSATQPKKKARASPSPPTGKSTTSGKTKIKEPEHTFFSSEEEDGKIAVASAVAKIENAASRRRAAKEARIAASVPIKKSGGKAKR